MRTPHTFQSLARLFPSADAPFAPPAKSPRKKNRPYNLYISSKPKFIVETTSIAYRVMRQFNGQNFESNLPGVYRFTHFTSKTTNDPLLEDLFPYGEYTFADGSIAALTITGNQPYVYVARNAKKVK